MGKKLTFLLSVLFLPVLGYSGYSPLANLPAYITVDIQNTSSSVTFNPFLTGPSGTIPVVDFINSLLALNDPNDANPLVYPTLSAIGSGAQSNNPVSDVIVKMPFETYAQGVVLGEVGSPLEAAKAQAVVARTFICGMILSSYSEGLPTSTGLVPYDTIGNASEQVFQVPVTSNAQFKADDIAMALQAVTLTRGQAIKCFNRSDSTTTNGTTTGSDEFIFAKFGQHFGSNSNDEMFNNVNDNYWDWPQYLKQRQSTGGDPGSGNTGDGALGFDQLASQTCAYAGWDYQGILFYWYAVNPPIVRAVDVYQNDDSTYDNLRMSSQWDDVCSSSVSTTTIDDMNICENPASRTLSPLQNDSLIPGSTAVMDITTSESIDTRQNLKVTLGAGVSITGSWLPFKQNHFPEWNGTFTVPTNPGSCPLSIFGLGVSIYITPPPSEQPTPSIASSVTLDTNPGTPAYMTLLGQ